MQRNKSPNTLLGKRLLVVTAHPDDESYGCAGTLAWHAKAGSQIFLLCATHGEKGQSHLAKPITNNKMAVRRKKELKAAAKVIGVNKLQLLNIPDGKVNKKTQTLLRAVNATVKKFKPDCIVSFGPCGISGHLDHIAAGKVAKRVAVSKHINFAAMVLSKKLQLNARNYLIKRRQSKHYTSHFTFLSPNTWFRINPTTKRKAILCHKSQMDGPKAFTGFPRYVVTGLLRHEYFRVWKS